MSSKVKKSEKKRKSSKTLDYTKLQDLYQQFQAELQRKEYHGWLDFEEIRIIDRFDRRKYTNVRRMKRADSARGKWKGLRDTFRGELKKVNKTIASGTNCQSTNWEYFDEMSFVKDQIYSNRRSLAHILKSQQRKHPTASSLVKKGNTLVGEDGVVVCKFELGEENEDTQGGSEEEAAARPEPQPSLPPTSLPPTQAQSTDDDYNFLMSILPQLRNLPTMRNLYVRLKIQELLFDEIVTLHGNN